MSENNSVLAAIMAALHAELDDVVSGYASEFCAGPIFEAISDTWREVEKAVADVLLDRGVER